MRPLELELVAFRSYEHAVVDWREHDLVTIAGDTGAGKTSLLDAIAFTLFGKTPEHGRPKDLLTLGHTHGEVRLTFALRDQVWRATRRYGKDAPEPAQLLERLESDGGPITETHADRVDERLRELVGMSFEAFTSAVLLAQGRFAQFLGAQPRDRDGILRELFSVASLDGARQAALRRQSTLEGEAAGVAQAAAGLPDHAPAGRTGAARDARDAAARVSALRELRPLAERAARLGEEAGRARDAAAATRRAAATLPAAADREALGRRLVAARGAVTAAEADRDAATRDRDTATAAREMLRMRHGGGAADLAALGELAARIRDVEADLPVRRRAADEAEAALAGRRAALEELVTQGTATAAEREAAATAIESMRSALAAQEAAAATRTAAGAAATAREAAVEAHDKASERRREAQTALEAALRRDAALAVRAGLGPGDPCPVCGGAVGDHPAEETGDLVALRAAADAAAGEERSRAAARAAAVAEADRAEAALRDAQAAADRAGDAPAPEALREAESRLAELAAQLDQRRAAHQAESTAIAERAGALGEERRRLEQDADQLAAARERLGAWGAHADAGAALAAAVAELREAETEADAASDRAAAAAQRAAAARETLHALEAGEIGALRSATARVAAAAGLTAPADDLDAEGLLAACGALADAAETAATRLDAEAHAASEAAEEAAAELAGRGGPLGVTDADTLPAVLRAAERARGDARQRLAAVEAAAAEASRLRAIEAAARAEAGLYATVARDLQANGFPRYLLGRYRERLAAGASARLQELSAGAYRFSGKEPDPLAVLDLRRGERSRPATTLSGGERFLASLALALGLSDIAAESGGRLDCLFLDEGFSTLDAESLEQALAGVERLAGEGRLIAVITHLPGVAERLGSVIRVAKDGGGASRIVEG